MDVTNGQELDALARRMAALMAAGPSISDAEYRKLQSLPIRPLPMAHAVAHAFA